MVAFLYFLDFYVFLFFLVFSCFLFYGVVDWCEDFLFDGRTRTGWECSDPQLSRCAFKVIGRHRQKWMNRFVTGNSDTDNRPFNRQMSHTGIFSGKILCSEVEPRLRQNLFIISTGMILSTSIPVYCREVSYHSFLVDSQACDIPNAFSLSHGSVVVNSPRYHSTGTWY